MNLRKIMAVCGWSLILVGCNHGNFRNDRALSAYVVQEMVRPPGEQYKFVRGTFSRIVFAIENNSDDVVVIRGCSVPEQLPDIDRWHGPRYGSTQHRPLEDVWVYNEMAQQLSQPVFATGVIPPHDSIEVVRWVLLEEENIEIDVAYQKLSAQDAVRHLYVETSVDRNYATETIFRHPEDFGKKTNSGVKTNWYVVIFPQPQQFPINRARLRCSVSLKEPPVSIETVRVVVGDEMRRAIYWKNQGKWLVETGRGNFLADDQGCTRIGDVDFLSFGVIASSYKTVGCILPLEGYEQFNPQIPKIGEGGFFDVGVTKVEHEDIIRLFESARDKSDTITVLPYDANGLGMKFYLLVGKFDEAARRKIAEQ